MKFLKYLVFAFVALFCIGRSQAQCNISYSLGYYMYTGIELANGESASGKTPGMSATVWTNVLTNGSASMALANYNCPDSFRTAIQNAINNATHYLRAYNKAGNTGGLLSGSALCASCWISEQNFQATTVPIATQLRWYYGADVVCSVGGVMSFTSSGGGDFNFLDYFEVAYTKSIRTSIGTYVPGHGYIARISSFCDIAHYPPDYNPTSIKTADSLALFFQEVTVCLRPIAPGPWFCAENPSDWPNAMELYTPQSPGYCTKNP